MSTQEYFIDGRILVNGRKGHLHLGFPIKMSDILASVYQLVPQLQANPYLFLNGLTATSLLPVQQGTEVTLGGLLTQPTSLDGDNNTYAFSFSNLFEFNLQALDAELNITGDLVSLVNDTIFNQATDIENVVSDTLQNTVTNLIQNQTSRYNTEVTDEFRFLNTLFSDCNNIIHELESADIVTSLQLSDFNGYKNHFKGEVKNGLDSYDYESGFYIKNNYQDDCIPQSFMNSYLKTVETDTLEKSSLLNLTPDFARLDVSLLDTSLNINRNSAVVNESNLVTTTVTDTVTGEFAQMRISTTETRFDYSDGLGNSNYSLPPYGNPADGDMMMMDSNNVARFTHHEEHIQVGEIASISPGVLVRIPIPFRTDGTFKYKLERITIVAETGQPGDTIQAFIQDFEGNFINSGPINIELQVQDFQHPSFLDLFTHTYSGPSLDDVTFTGNNSTLWFFGVSLASIQPPNTDWNNALFVFTFKRQTI